MAQDYSSLTVVQIRDIFKSKGIPTTGLTRKQQLIDRLLQEDANQANSDEHATHSPPAATASPSQTERLPIDSSQTKQEDEQPLSQPQQNAPDTEIGSENNLTTADDRVEAASIVAEPVPTTIHERDEIDAKPANSSSPPDAVLPTDQPDVAPGTSEDHRRIPDAEKHEETSSDGDAAAQPANPSPPADAVLPTDQPDVTPNTLEDDRRMQDEEIHEEKHEETPSDRNTAAQPANPSPPADAVLPIEQPYVASGTPEDDRRVQDEGKAGEASSDRNSVSEAQQTHSATSSTATIASPSPPEESRKRKRRSASPPPSPEEIVRKKTKQEVDEERVILKEDVAATSTSHPQETSTPPSITKVGQDREKRFRDLVAPLADKPIIATTPGSQDAPDGRSASPSLHPATCALYIRNLKRPLRPDMVKDHLAALAHSPGGARDNSESRAADEEVIRHFFLDTIRTHCFVIFNSVQAASRVRSALHDKIWPPEGIREPLWVDYIPEDRVEEWISIETRAVGTRRWEVQYEELEDGAVTTELRDSTGASLSAPRRSVSDLHSSANSSSQARKQNPSGRVQREPLSGPGQGEQRTPSFVALDTLFKSTQAKPKLYFQPVDREVVNKRVGELERLTSRDHDMGLGGSGHADSRRYTFEDDEMLVDNGPEFGLRRQRPPPRRFRRGR